MFNKKNLPFSNELFNDIAATYGTPVFVYDEAGIRARAKELDDAFSWTRSFNKGQKNFFAVKATPTPGILRVLHDMGMGFDCSSRPELRMVEQTGLVDTGISYSSNNTSDEDYQYANKLGALINVDKYGYVGQVKKALGGKLPDRMSIRYNPGSQKEGNDIIGEPLYSKFGARDDQVLLALKDMKYAGVKEVGIHIMAVSNESRPESFGETARLLKVLVERAKTEYDVKVDFLNIGGGLGINYHPDEAKIDVNAVGEAVRRELEALEIPVYTEHGRFITGSNGYLLTSVTHGIQETWQKFLQVDTSVNNIARLATVTNAYHEVHVIGKEADEREPVYVVGSMCASTDRMFKNIPLPKTVQPGDLLVIQDAGAHTRANTHNYNFQLRAGEVLVHPDGTHTLIRRHETETDLFATTKNL